MITWQQVKEFVGGLSDQQLGMEVLVVENDDGQLGISFPITSLGIHQEDTLGIHQGESDDLGGSQPFLTMPPIDSVV